MVDAQAVGLSLQHLPWVSVIVFGLAAAGVGLFDVSLPRGDVIGVSGAIDAAALALLGPAAAVLSCLVGIGGAFLVRRGADRPVRLGVTLSARMGGLLTAAMTLNTLDLSVSNQELRAIMLGLVTGTVFLSAELLIVLVFSSARTDRSFWRLIRGNISVQMPFMLAQMSAVTLTVLTYDRMGDWSLLVLLALLLLIRQSHAMLLDIREAYRATVEVLAEVAEGCRAGEDGHAHRTAKIAREIASRCGLGPIEIEKVSYAALLHDIGRIGDSVHDQCPSSSVIDGVESFVDIIGILRIVDGLHSEGQAASERDKLAAYVVALASDIDVAVTGDTAERGRTAVKLAELVPSTLRAKAVGAAVRLGYGVPALV